MKRFFLLVSWCRFLLNPISVVLVLSSIFIIANLYLAQHTSPFVSDDVAWQSTLMTWSPTNGHVAYMGNKDNFIMNVPLLALLGNLFAPTRTLLWVEAAIMAVVDFVLFYIAGLYFLKKCKVKIGYRSLLPFLWLASFGYSFATLFLNTDWRDFELGLSFVCFMLVAKIYFGELDPLKSWGSKIVSLVITLLLGVIIFSDPYFLYFTLTPIVALALVLFFLKKLSKLQALTILAMILLGLVFEKIIALVLSKVGLVVPPAGQQYLVDYNTLYTNAGLEVKSILNIFGANFFGLPVIGLATLTAAANFGVISFVFYRLLGIRFRKEYMSRFGLPLGLWATFLGLLSAFVIIVYLISGFDAYRYFAIMAFAFTLLLPLYSSKLKPVGASALVVLVGIALVLNMATSIHEVNYPKADATGNIANAANYGVVAAVKKLGLTKGYTGYWSGNINTYLAGGKASFLPVVCTNGRTMPYHQLVDDSLFNVSTGSSFYLLDPDAYGVPPTCDEAQLLGQFGPPQGTVKVLDKTIMIYGYDLATKMR